MWFMASTRSRDCPQNCCLAAAAAAVAAASASRGRVAVSPAAAMEAKRSRRRGRSHRRRKWHHRTRPRHSHHHCCCCCHGGPSGGPRRRRRWARARGCRSTRARPPSRRRSRQPRRVTVLSTCCYSSFSWLRSLCPRVRATWLLLAIASWASFSPSRTCLRRRHRARRRSTEHAWQWARP